MKKIIFTLVLLVTILPSFVSANTQKIDETQAKIEALMAQIKFLTEEISRLQKDVNINDKVEVLASKDRTPRIMYWWGKVNQHLDVKSGLWMTDPDGVSGANIDMLEYCQKWYPKTESVKKHKFETIKHWKNRGNLLNFESRKMSYECSEKQSSKPTPVVSVIDQTIPLTVTQTSNSSEGKVDSDMQIMYWWGKVNQHLEDGDWETDPDGTSGASIDMLDYCQKWYPDTIAVKENKLVTTDGWKNAGNLGDFTTMKMSYYCLQD